MILDKVNKDNSKINKENRILNDKIFNKRVQMQKKKNIDDVYH